MLALAILTSGQQLQPLCAIGKTASSITPLHASHDPPATSERATVPAVLCNVAARRSAHPITSLASPAPTVLCADRVGQMTKTYNDIDAVTRLLEEVGCAAFTCRAS